VSSFYFAFRTGFKLRSSHFKRGAEIEGEVYCLLGYAAVWFGVMVQRFRGIHFYFFRIGRIKRAENHSELVQKIQDRRCGWWYSKNR
jgi:hypothetical protein